MRIRSPYLCRPVYLAAYQSINSTNGGAGLFACPGAPGPLAARHSLLGVTVGAAALSGGEGGKPLPPPPLSPRHSESARRQRPYSELSH
jgi:hypothetical protein